MDDNVMHIFGFVIKPIHVSVFYNSIFLLMGAGSIYAWFKTRWQSRAVIAICTAMWHTL